MPTRSFFPYRTAPDQLMFELHAADGTAIPSSNGSLLAYEQDFETLEIRADVVMVDDVLGRVIDPSEHDDPPAEVRLVCRSDRSRARHSVPLDGDGIYETTLVFDRQEWSGDVEIQAVMFRTRRNGSVSPASGFATERGSLLAWSEPRRLVLDEPSRPLGDRLDVQWENFAESTNFRRRAHPDHLFDLDTSTGERPIIYCNSGLRALRAILNSRAPHGKVASIRDATNYMIAHQVWSSLLSIALAEVARAGAKALEDASVEEILDTVGGDWQRRILRDWSRWLYPGETAEAALEKVVVGAGSPEVVEEIMTLLPHAIQKRFLTFRGHEKLVNQFEAVSVTAP